MIKPMEGIIKDAKKTIGKFAPRINHILSSPDSFAAHCALSLLAKKFNTYPGDFHRVAIKITHDPYKAEKLKDLDEEEGCWLTRFATDCNK